jgi:hypothetical protein
MSDPLTPTDSVLITQFEKNKKEEVRVSIDTYHGKKLVNFRVFYKDADGTMKPGKQGLALSADLYKDLAAAVVAAGQHLKSLGLL